MQLEGLADWLVARLEQQPAARPLYATDSLARDYAPGAAFADVASGVLAFPLSRSGRNLMLWFRPETIQTVAWAGNPQDKPTVPGPHGPRLTPRRSFELFRDSVHQRSLPWTPVEVEAAARLRMLVVELVVGRAERLADLNADLARSNEELDAFAYVASHDLKEPLRGIHKYAHQLLEDAAIGNAEQRSKLDGLMRLTLRMDSLLDALLHFSRVGRLEMAFEATDLNEVLAEAVEMVGSRTAPGQQPVVVPRPLPVVRCDRVRCREIFVNLLSNALKYNDAAQKRVEVGYLHPGEDRPGPGAPAEAAGHVVYYVRDNGIGIPGEALRKGVPDVQAAARARRVRRRHRRRADHRQEAGRAPPRAGLDRIGRGRRQHVLLHPAGPRRGRAMSAATRLTPVVIVEDSDEDYDTVVQAVRQAGIAVEVRRALSGGECLELLRSAAAERPALVLMDLNTPGTDGREALAAIKRDDALKTCPVVVFSTSADPRDLSACYAAGANAFHVKPVRHPDHLQLVTELLTYWIGRVVLPQARQVRP